MPVLLGFVPAFALALAFAAALAFAFALAFAAALAFAFALALALLPGVEFESSDCCSVAICGRCDCTATPIDGCIPYD